MIDIIIFQTERAFVGIVAIILQDSYAKFGIPRLLAERGVGIDTPGDKKGIRT